MDDAFLSAEAGDEVLFDLVVTKALQRQVIVALTLFCRGSNRCVIGFTRDLQSISISTGTVHNVIHSREP